MRWSLSQNTAQRQHNIIVASAVFKVNSLLHNNTVVGMSAMLLPMIVDEHMPVKPATSTHSQLSPVDATWLR